jgi:formylglycine-generating enzyme required for sulfatase activity
MVGTGGGAFVLMRPGYHPPAPAPIDNAWVRVKAPETPVVLGISSSDADASVHGFRPGRKITSPARSFDLQEHEVTWSEIEPWLAIAHTALPVELPPWAKDPSTRRSLPVTGVTWAIAERYCESVGGALPTEEEWEYAARGATLRPHSWGSDPLDRMRTRAYLGTKAEPAPVKTSTQDRTPDLLIYDLDGNVQEWTLELWRHDLPGGDDSAQTIGQDTTLRSLRGLPLDEDPPRVIQDATAAYHERWCATGPCVKKTFFKLKYVGFRCARAVR